MISRNRWNPWKQNISPPINVSSRNRLAEPGKRFPRNRSAFVQAGTRASWPKFTRWIVNCSSLFLRIERFESQFRIFMIEFENCASKNFDTKKRIFGFEYIFFLWILDHDKDFRVDRQESERTIFCSDKRHGRTSSDTSNRWNLIKIVTAYFDEGSTAAPFHRSFHRFSRKWKAIES